MMQSFVSLGVVTADLDRRGLQPRLRTGHARPHRHLHYVFLNNVGQAPNPAVRTDRAVPGLLRLPAHRGGPDAGADHRRLRRSRAASRATSPFLTAWSLLVYVPLAHWIWGGGFLQQWGVLDFGGGMVVHASAGFAALASVYVVKKRVFAPGEEERPSNIPLIAIGLGAALVRLARRQPGRRHARQRHRRAGVRQHLHRRRPGDARLDVHRLGAHRQGRHGRRPDRRARRPGRRDPCAGYVPTWAAAVIALIAGWVCYGAVQLRAKRGWDDSLDVWGVHGVGGAARVAARRLVRLRLGRRSRRPAGRQRQAVRPAAAPAWRSPSAMPSRELRASSRWSTWSPASSCRTTCRSRGSTQELHGETAYDLT